MVVGIIFGGQARATAASLCGVLAYAPTGNCTQGQDYTALTGLNGTSDQMKNQFINKMNGFLNGQKHQKVGANYTIDQVLGGPGWEDRIRSSSVTLSRGNYSFNYNTAYNSVTNQVIKYADTDTRQSLIIRYNGVVVGAIKLDCGNPLSNLPGLPKNWSLTGNSYVNPPGQPNNYQSNTSASPGEEVTFRHGVRNTTGPNANYTWRVQDTLTPGNANSWAGGGLPSNSVANVDKNDARPEAASYPGDWGGKAKYSIPGNLYARTQYCQRVEYNNANGPGTTPYPNNAAHSDRACVEVEGWKLDGNSYVTKNSDGSGFSSSVTVKPGQTVIFKHGVRNVNPSSINSAIIWGKASYTWTVAERGTIPGQANTYDYGGGNPNAPLPSNTVNLVAKNDARPDANNYPGDWGNKAKYTIPSTAKDGDRYCQRIEYSKANGPNTTPYPNPGNSTEACVTVDDPGWKLTGSSTVGKEGGSFGNCVQARAGETVIFRHGVLNTAGSTAANYTWNVQKKKNSGSWSSDGNPSGSPSGVNGGTWSPTADSYPTTYYGAARFKVPVDARIGDKYYQRITYTNGTGPGTSSGSSTEACVNVQEGFGVAPVPNAELDPSGEDPERLKYDGSIRVDGLNSSKSVNVTWIACVYKGTRAESAICTGTNLVPTTSGTTSIPAGGGSRVVLPANSIPKGNLGALNAGDQYCTRIWVSFTGGSMNESNTVTETYGPKAVDDCDVVHNKPYFKVYGSGVYAGGDFQRLGSCQATGSGRGLLGAWYNNSSAKRGASSELSAIALAKIVGYASGQTVANKPSASDLSFSNTENISPGIESPGLGGNFAAGNCMTTVEEPETTTPIGSTFTPGTAGSYKRPGNSSLELGGSTISGNHSIFVNGDVYINGNIRYSQAGWTTENIPSFVLQVTNGNIYIGANVTELDGLYIAQRTSSGTKGKIYTCAKNTGGVFSPETSGNMYDNCKNQLVVHGSFVANQVNLMRTFGSLRNSTNNDIRTSGNKGGCVNAGVYTMQKSCAAEVFDFSPEMYLSNPAIQQRGNGVPQYDAITSLPPVL